jgi:hypothetical protein
MQSNKSILRIIKFVAAELTFIGGVWNLSLSTKCLEVHRLAYAAGGISVALDVIILILPIPCCARLQMNTKKKISVMFSMYFFIFHPS